MTGTAPPGVTLHLGPGLVGRARRWTWRGHVYLGVEARTVFRLIDGTLHLDDAPQPEPAFEGGDAIPTRGATSIVVEGDHATPRSPGAVVLTVGLADRVVEEPIGRAAAAPGLADRAVRADPDGVLVLADDVDPGQLGVAADRATLRLRGDEWLRVRWLDGGELRARLPGWIPHVRARLAGQPAFSVATRVDRVVVRPHPVRTSARRAEASATIVVSSSATIPLPGRGAPAAVWALLGHVDEEPSWPRSARDVALRGAAVTGGVQTVALTELLGESDATGGALAFAGTMVLADSSLGARMSPPEPTVLLADALPPPAVAPPLPVLRDETVSLADLLDAPPQTTPPQTISLGDGAAAAAPMWPFATPAPEARDVAAPAAAPAMHLPWESPAPVVRARGAQQVTMVLGEAVDAHGPASVRKAAAAVPLATARPRVRGRAQPEVQVLGDAQVVLVPWQVRPPRPSLTVVVAVRASGDDLATWSAPAPADDAAVRLVDGVAAATLGLEAALQHAPFKLEADVLLRGHAHPPRAGATAFEVALGFGHRGHRVERRFAVLGRRRWVKRWGLLTEASPPEPIDRVPLAYTSAFGGPGHPENPRGKGHRAGIGDELPAIEDPSSPIVTPDDAPAPWSPAARPTEALLGRSGTFDARWRAERFPWFPADFDWTTLQLAPASQRLPLLRGDEPFVVRGTQPGGATWGGALPGRRIRVLAIGGDGSVAEHPCRLDTVVLDADTREADLTFRTLLESMDSSPVDAARIVVVVEERGVDTPLDELLRRIAEADAAGAAAAAGTPPTPPPGRRPPDLGGRDTRGIDLAGARLDDTILDGLDFTGANLDGASLRRVSAIGTIFRGAVLDGADLSDAELGGAVLDEARLDGARLDGCRADAATLRAARGRRVSFAGAALSRCRFDGATLPGARFDEATLDDAVLDGASLDNARFLEVRASRITARGARMTNVLAAHARFDGGDLDRAVLTGSTWTGASLAGASLREVDAEGMTLDDACCDAARFDHAALKQARFVGASCVGTSFLGADLFGVVFEAATLRDADLRASNLFGVSTFDAKMLGLRIEGAHLGGTTFPATATMLRRDGEGT